MSSSESATTSQPPTNTAGRTHITFDPCKDIPATAITQLGLVGPPRPDSQSDGSIENVFCMYDSSGDYFVTIAASNYSLDMVKKVDNHWGYQEFEVGGRQALFGYRKPQGNTESCSLDIAASTGVYGVLVGTGRHSFAPYPDCLAAARKSAEVLVPYFPQ